MNKESKVQIIVNWDQNVSLTGWYAKLKKKYSLAKKLNCIKIIGYYKSKRRIITYYYFYSILIV